MDIKIQLLIDGVLTERVFLIRPEGHKLTDVTEMMDYIQGHYSAKRQKQLCEKCGDYKVRVETDDWSKESRRICRECGVL